MLSDSQEYVLVRKGASAELRQLPVRIFFCSYSTYAKLPHRIAEAKKLSLRSSGTLASWTNAPHGVLVSSIPQGPNRETLNHSPNLPIFVARKGVRTTAARCLYQHLPCRDLVNTMCMDLPSLRIGPLVGLATLDGLHSEA